MRNRELRRGSTCSTPQTASKTALEKFKIVFAFVICGVAAGGLSVPEANAAFPYVPAGPSGTRTSEDTDNVNTEFVVDLPTGIAPGDLIIAFAAHDKDNTATWPSPWVEMVDASNSTENSLFVAYLIASGGETSVTVATTPNPDRSHHIAIRIPAASWHGTTPPEVSSTIATGNSANPNSASLTPSWGAADTLWISTAAYTDFDTDGPVTSYPSSYSDNQNFYGPIGSSCGIGIASRELNGASEDPGPFAITIANFWAAATIAVRPRTPVNYRSIGTAADYTTGTIDATDGSAVVTGTGTSWQTANRGRGDRIDINGTDYTILSVDSETQLTLTATVGGGNYSGAYTISRQYSNLAAWEDCVDGGPCSFFAVASSSLVTDNRREVGIAYKDSVFMPASKVEIRGATTDADHSITLTAAAGNRHDGTPGAGVVYQGTGTGDTGLWIRDAFVTVEWLEFTGIMGANNIAAIRVYRDAAPEGQNAVISHLLIHDFADGNPGQDVMGIRFSGALSGKSATVRNTMIWNGDRIGIEADASGDTVVIENVSIDHMDVTNGQGIDAVDSTVTVTNTIVTTNPSGDFVASGTGTYAGASSNNTASDGSAPGSNPDSQLASALFVAPNADLHLKPGVNPAVDSALTLAPSFLDIDGGTRTVVTNWDRGADELEVTTVVELLSFEATGVDRAIELEWETGSELNNLGFHLYRSTAANGSYERITSTVIPGLGSSPRGANYVYRDSRLENGFTYYYKLEDIETMGRSEFHGPVSAEPSAGAGASADGSDTSPRGRITYGDPSANTFRVMTRSNRHAVLELVTNGFYAEPQDDGSVRITIPDFAELSEVASSSIPAKSAWLDAVAGRQVKLVSVQAHELEAFTGLRPAGPDVPEVVATPDGTVRAARRRRQLRTTFREEGMVPSEAARIVTVGFQGEVKKALVELAPLRWDSERGQLLLSRRLVVRLSFRGREPAEHTTDGVRGRRERGRRARNQESVVARFATTAPGLYAVAHEDVFRGRGGVRASSLRLSRQGEDVAFHLDGIRFAPGSSLYFVSEGASANPYGNEAVYELELGQSGTLMAEVTASPSGNVTSHYRKELEQERNRYYQAALVEAPDLWLWDMLLAPVSKSYPFEVSDLATTTQFSGLSVWLQGMSDTAVAPDHRVRVLVNGTFIDEVSWDGKTSHRIDVDLLPGTLIEGDNVLELDNVGDTGAPYSMVMLDRFAVRYPRLPKAEGGMLEGIWEESGLAEVAGVGTSSHVIDVTGDSPRWLIGTERTDTGGVRFRAEAGRRYLAVGADAVRRPDVRKMSANRLRSPQNRADYLIVGPRAFLPAAKPLLELRRRQGLEEKAVSIEDVYSEFGHGESTPEAIREFLTYAYHHWRAPAPRYVVLLGDATYDFKDYLATGVRNQVPPLIVKTSFLWTASDPSYAAVNGEDVLPDLGIGRLPAATADEARSMMEKIVAYETGDANLQGTTVLIADNPDAAGDFVADAEKLASGALAGRDLRKIYSSELGTTAAREAIQESFDDGASLMSYLGHGGIHLWASEILLNTAQVDLFSAQRQQPLVLTMNCLNGYYHFPFFDSLSEKLVKTEGKGAIAAFSPSGLSVNGPAQRFHTALLTELLSGRHERLGDAVLAAQLVYAETGSFPELLSIYHLLGDPALTLK